MRMGLWIFEKALFILLIYFCFVFWTCYSFILLPLPFTKTVKSILQLSSNQNRSEIKESLSGEMVFPIHGTYLTIIELESESLNKKATKIKWKCKKNIKKW